MSSLPDEQRPIWGVWDVDGQRFVSGMLTFAQAEEHAEP